MSRRANSRPKSSPSTRSSSPWLICGLTDHSNITQANFTTHSQKCACWLVSRSLFATLSLAFTTGPFRKSRDAISHCAGEETHEELLIALSLGGWLYFRFGFADVCANIPVSRLDSEIAITALHASAARHAPEEKARSSRLMPIYSTAPACTETSVPIVTADLTTPRVTTVSLFIRRLRSS